MIPVSRSTISCAIPRMTCLPPDVWNVIHGYTNAAAAHDESAS